MTNHPDGFIYSNTSFGVSQIEADTGLATGVTIGGRGSGLGITTDPQTDDVVYLGRDCRFRGVCTVFTVNPAGGPTGVFVRLYGVDLIDGIQFSPERTRAWTAFGSPEDCAARLRMYAGCGVRHIGLRITAGDQVGQLERLIDEVLPIVQMA